MDMDLRIRKSKHYLRKSIISLLQRISFADINVSMICKEAHVSRVTFYNYYRDKNELVEDIVKIILSSTIRKTHIEMGTRNVDIGFFQCLLTNIVENCYWYEKSIPELKSVENIDVKNIIDKIFFSEISQFMKRFVEMHHIKIDYNIATSFTVGGFSKMIFDWIRDSDADNCEENKELLKDTINNIFSRLNKNKPFLECCCVN